MTDDATVIGEATPVSIPDPAEPITQRRLLGLAIPIIGENLLQTGLSVVDTVIVAALGASALAGVGIASEVVFFLISVISAFSVAGTVVVSHAIGARDRAGANRLARQTVAWGLVVMIPLSVTTWTLTPALIGIFGTTPEVTAEAITYLRITAVGLGALLLTFVFGAVLRAAGDSRTPLYASIVANVVNAAATYLLVFGELGFPRLEVAGSAWGTIIGRSTGALMLGWLLVSGRRRVSLAGRSGWRPRVEPARALSHIGVPAAVERMVANIGITALVLIVARIGTEALAAQQIVFTAFAVAPVPIFGLSTATTVLVGQSFGARNVVGMRTAPAISLRWAMIGAIVGAAVLTMLARPIFGLFTSNASVIDQGDGALAILGLTLPVWAYHAVFGGSLRAMGDARTPMITNLVANWLGVGLAWASVGWLDGGLTMVWAAQAIPCPIMLLVVPIFRRKLAYRAAEIAAAA